MRLLHHLLGKPVSRRTAVVAAGAPLAAMLATAPTREPTPAACPTPCDDDCTVVCHEGHQPPWKRSHDPGACPTPDDGATVLALSELQGQLARTGERLERLAAELEARHVRYAWTEQLAAELRAIAHDTPTEE